MKTLPVFLVGLERRRCVVIGSDEIAAQKVHDLRAAGAANIDVFAPAPVPALEALADGTAVRLHRRAWVEPDLDGAALAITTERDHELNARVWRAAEERNVLLNAADDPPHCHFFAGSVIRRGEFTIAISTGGHAPVLAVRLRERLERELGPEVERFMALAERFRPLVTKRVDGMPARRALWYRVIDSEVMALLRDGDEDGAWALALRMLDEAAGDG